MKNRLGFFLIMVMGLIGLPCCVKEEPISDANGEKSEESTVSLATRLPLIKDTYVIIRTPKEALAGFNIIDDGGGPIIDRGVCWSTFKYPTTADNYSESKTPITKDSHYHIGGLKISTKYYLRAFATNSIGKAYGDLITFTTPASALLPNFNPDLTYGSVTDADGNNYKTIQIGTQTWLAENLKTTRYNDGSPILPGTGGPAGYTTWFDIGEGAYCWYDNDAATFKDGYGAIYNWHAVSTGKLCPTEWHVPTYSEWTILVTFLGGEVEAFNEVSENAYIHWSSSNNSIYESGFTPAPAGDLTGWGFLPGGSFWWSSTPRPIEGDAAAYLISFDILAFEPQSYGYTVRCLKNN